MDSRTRQALNAINRAFYDAQAQEFSDTRDHPWPGWARLLPRLAGSEALRLLDVGCGNARFAAFLEQALDRPLEHTGVDSSEPLLAIARERFPEARLLQHDLVLDAPDTLPDGPFDLITLFGVSHHIPGERQRTELAKALATRLAAQGLLVLSFWQFAAEERFRAHMIPWNEQSIDVEQLEDGDHLLRWGKPPGSVRYCHDTGSEERERLSRNLGLQAVDEFSADGRSGELNRYLVLQRR